MKQLLPFKDLQKGNWAEESIYKLVAFGIISGYPDHSFRLSDQITREAFIKILISSDLQKQIIDRPMSLKDVNSSNWSYLFIKKAYDLELIDFMIQDGNFNPLSNIKREEVAILIGKYLLHSIEKAEAEKWLTTEWKEHEKSRNFKDKIDIGDSLKPYLFYSSYRGIMVGDEKGNFRPKASLTRGEAAAIIERTINERTNDSKIAAVGFYAIKSYNNIDKINLLDDVIFGWSHLEYIEPGKAQLNTKSTEYRFPSGWETVLETVNHQNVSKDLMVYADNKDQLISKFLNDPLARQNFLQSLNETLANELYGFTGVCIDFEGLKNVDDQEVYISFLKELKSSIGNKSLTVAVPPTNYYKGYDLQGIGDVSNQVIVMAYDYTHKESYLPSAPLPLVNEAIVTALKYIPKEKVILGISKQANQWISSSNGEVQLKNPAIELVEQRLIKTDSKVEFSLPFYLTNISYNEQGNQNIIWYEDSNSIEQKIWLAKYYGLRGISLWHMGNYTPSDWNIIQNNLD